MGHPVVIRVGVIGTGIMGSDHARLLSSVVAGATLAATFDLDPVRAAAAASLSPTSRVFDDPLALIADDGIDAVLVASSDASHERFVLACLAAGKPVICEKPLAPAVAGARTIVDAEMALGRRLVSVGFMRRHDPGYVAVKNALADGSLGHALIVHNVHRNAAAGRDVPSAHLITGSAVHELDIMRWLLDEEIVAVSVHRPRAARASGASADPMFLVVETESGVLADIEVFVNASYGYEVRCEVVGELGTITLDAPAVVQRRQSFTRATAIAPDWRPRFAEAYRLELQDWVDSIVHGRRSTSASAWDGYLATVVAAAAVEALVEYRRVEIARPERPPLYG
jgi:myo-inositol 2-dehydrogenase/D-chiro-inositol 1-dehydrogenase